MSWVKLDDQFFMHPKVLPLSRGAKLLYLSALTYASAQLTDGHLNEAAVSAVARTVGVQPRLSADLRDAGLWDRTEDGYVIHDYLAYNPSREQVLRARQAAAERTARWRGKRGARDGVSDGVSTPSPAHGPAHGPNESALPSTDVESARTSALAAARTKRAAIAASIHQAAGA